MTAFWIAIICAAVSGLCFGFAWGSVSSRNAMKRMAIKHELASWSRDSRGGVQFTWHNWLPNENKGLSSDCQRLQELAEGAAKERDALKIGLKELLTGLASMAEVRLKDDKDES